MKQSHEYLAGFRAGYRARQAQHRMARWNPALGEFELQCPECRSRGNESYWPLTLEYWSPRSVRRCRACHLERDRAKQRARRLDPDARARDAATSAAWRESHPGYNSATAALWRAQNPERKRAADRARYAARKAA